MSTIPDFSPPPHVKAALHKSGFTITNELGRGGMGIVYRANDTRLERDVAVKVLPAHLTHDAHIRERFVREARTAAKLSHPHIVPIYQADEVDGVAFLIMEFIDGETLGDRIRTRGALQVRETVHCLQQVAWALAYAHARGIVHRDVKPDNILIDRSSGRAVVTDFGIARSADADDMTEQGTLIGSLHYMSPEQIQGKPVDGRADLYSLGVTAFHAFSARLPFEDSEIRVLAVAHASRTPPPLASVSSLSPAVAAVIDRCLEKTPDDRWTSGEELAAALDAALHASLDTDPRARKLTTQQAKFVWQRAAQLQAQSAHQLESSTLPTDTEDLPGEVSGYELRHVEAAAEDVGISKRFVALAVAQVADSQRGDLTASQSNWVTKAAPFWLGTDVTGFVVRKRVRASADKVLKVMGDVWRRDPFGLVLKETVGAHPLDGGILIFDLPHRTSDSAVLAQWMGTRFKLETKQLSVSIDARSKDSCDVEVRVDIAGGRRNNVLASSIISGVVGSLGTGGTVAIGAGLGTALSLMVAPAALLGGAFGAGALAWYRWLYRGAITQSKREIERAIAQLDSEIQSFAVFGERPSESSTQISVERQVDQKVITD